MHYVHNLYERIVMPRLIATLGFIGYLPAPGTCATLVTLLLVYGLYSMGASLYLYALSIVIATIVGFYASKNALRYFHHHDPCEMVIDELVGCLITFFAVPLSVSSVIVGFMLFRFFDITKIGGIRWLERRPGAWGIMLDDIGAGIASNVILQGLYGSSLFS